MNTEYSKLDTEQAMLLDNSDCFVPKKDGEANITIVVNMVADADPKAIADMVAQRVRAELTPRG